MEIKVMLDLTERMENVLRDLTAALKPCPTTADEIPETEEVQLTARVPVTVHVEPVQEAPLAPVSEAPAYTLPQVAKAGADLLQAKPDLQPALMDLIHRYGAQTVQDIPQDKLGAFATELRQMGAVI